ncbi:MAG TPA: MBL fold metallo-hydrolase [bacterium]|nr:MBL fold metallo-hydrolase [bacterium]
MEKIKKQFKYYFVGLLFLITIFVWYAVCAETRSGLTVAFLDVGQGDAIFIESPNGNQLLLDAGPNDKVLRELSKIMPFYDRSIDMIIESHPDKDHIGGFVEVLRRYNVDLAMEPGVHSKSAVYRELNNLIAEKGIKKILARRGMRVDFGDGVYLNILFPDRDVSNVDTNTASIVAKLVYGKTSFLLTGDSPKAIENYLVSVDGESLKSDVLKVGHHGSKTSASELFFGYVSPRYAIISAGAGNRYGHPHKETIDLLDQFEIPILSTINLGTIKIKSDGKGIMIAN